MKTVAETIAATLASHGCQFAFGVGGGAALHLLHALEAEEGVTLLAMNHEQSAAIAAESIGRLTGTPGVCVATSGPGATNLLTGVAGAFYDSVPVIALTGQVSTTRRLSTPGLRQYGFQETPIDQIAAKLCKGVFVITDPSQAEKQVCEAVALACDGRPGPVLIDVPDDVQRLNVEPPAFHLAASDCLASRKTEELVIEEGRGLIRLLQESSRPVLVLGAGINSLAHSSQLEEFVTGLGIPTLLTWGACNALSRDHRLNYGFFGTHGPRVGNHIIQNSDLIISIGSRLDTKATGSPPSSFGREAKKIVVDIDRSELDKFEEIGLEVDLRIWCSAIALIEFLLKSLPTQKDFQSWFDYCNHVRLTLAQEAPDEDEPSGLNPHLFLSVLFDSAPARLNAFVDTGTVLPFTMNAFPFSKKRRVFHDFNNTAMGWSVPAAIAGGMSDPTRSVLVLIGDGSTLMTSGELVRLSSSVQNIKLILLDNGGHSMIRQTQDQWLGSNYVASQKPELAFPDFPKLLSASGFKVAHFERLQDLESVQSFWAEDGPVAGILKISPEWKPAPIVKFGAPLEDQDPKLDSKIFESVSLITPTAFSKERHGL